MLIAEAPREELPKEGAVYVGSSEMPKRNSVPSTTRSQYINNSRAGARRKRKHTELKRSGVLEFSYWRHTPGVPGYPAGGTAGVENRG